MDTRVEGILREARDGRCPTRDDIIYLLGFDEYTIEAAMMRNVGNEITRKRFNNTAVITGQIGVDSAPCDGNCKFCMFAAAYTKPKTVLMTKEQVLAKFQSYVDGGATGAFLMTMNTFGYEGFLDMCEWLHAQLPAGIEVIANVGDLTPSQFLELKSVGVTGAYHALRLREGIDTRLTPASRRTTIEAMLDAGLDWYTNTEPIGPEHSPEELADSIAFTQELKPASTGAQQRFAVKGSPLFDLGTISLARVSQIVAIVTMAMLDNERLKSITANLSHPGAYFSGANRSSAEDGEPQENADDLGGYSTADWRGSSGKITTRDVREWFKAAGFSSLADPQGNPTRPLW